MGKTLQAQADEVKKLSDNLSLAVDENIKFKTKALANRGDEGLSKTNQTIAETKSDKIMQLQTELSAESMKLNFLATGFQTALKAVGDSLSTMGRG
jgi:uncharacterized protein (DUF342 family)